jgi:5'-methylthioadenosine phosphorylase
MSSRIAVIGGTGLYLWDGFEAADEVVVETPYGHTSSPIKVGRIGDTEVAFLARHGRGHRFAPTEVPYRANVYALKMLNVSRVFSVSAVGSMREDIALTEPVIVDQFIDRTYARKATFFEDGIAAHVSMAEPTCPALRAILAGSAARTGVPARTGGAYVCIEGPQFSSRAESLAYRQIGVDVIGMTNATEAKLAREAELCYVTIALPTDYDCWHGGHDDVSVGSVLERLAQGTARARALILDAIANLDGCGPCRCGRALDGAIITDRDLVGREVRERLAPIIGRYI